MIKVRYKRGKLDWIKKSDKKVLLEKKNLKSKVYFSVKVSE